PEGPTTPTVSPLATSRSRPRRILTSPAALASLSSTPVRRIIAWFWESSAMPLRIAPLWITSSRIAPSRHLHRLLAFTILIQGLPGPGPAPAAESGPLKILALGDSLTSGYGLPQDQGFVPQLQKALAAAGIEARVINAGVGGDTSAGGLARLDWALADD